MPATRPRFFADPQAFRSWLAAHHRGATELLVGFYKRDWVVSAKKPETRLKRLDALIEASEAGRRLR